METVQYWTFTGLVLGSTAVARGLEFPETVESLFHTFESNLQRDHDLEYFTSLSFLNRGDEACGKEPITTAVSRGSIYLRER